MTSRYFISRTIQHNATITILDIIRRPVFYEREREEKVGVGGVIETEFGSLEGSQAVPASPSGKGLSFMREREREKVRVGGVIETEFGSLEGSQAVPASLSGKVLNLVVCILLRVLGQVQGFRLTQQWFPFRLKMVIKPKHVAVTE
jgi:hypothetical protein